MYGKYKHVTLFIKLYTSPPCLIMFIAHVTLLYSLIILKGAYISSYNDWIVLQHRVHRHENAVVAFIGAIISTMWV